MHTWSVMRLTILRHLRTSPIRVLVTVAGVAIGVATFTAIQTTNESVLSSFTRAIDLVAGRTTLEISGGELGIDERFLPAIQRVEGVSAAAPIIHTVAAVADRPGDALLLMGVDLFAEDPFREYRLADGDRPPAMEELLSPDAIFVTTAFARTHGLRKGESLTLLVGLRRQRFSVKGLLAPQGPARAFDGNIAILDIAAAQVAFGKLGRLDRIDLVTHEPVPLDEIRAHLATLLPPHLTIQRPDRRGYQVEKMLRAFRLNLTALSAIALLVSLFLVYNAVSLSVLERRRQIGILRSLGLTRGGVAALFAAEGMTLGLLGSLLGVGGGLLLGRALLQGVSKTVSTLYAYLQVEEIEVSPVVLLTALGLGSVGALLASLAPAYAASRIAPKDAIQVGSFERTWMRRSRLAMLGGLLLLVASFLLTRPGPVAGAPLFGYLSLACLIFGVACFTPQLLRLTGAGIHSLCGGRRAPLLALAAGNLSSQVGRSAVAVAAMMTAIAMLVGLTLMIGSFRRTVELWIEQTIRADLIVSPAARFVKGSHARLSHTFIEGAARISGIAALDPFIGKRVELLGQEGLLAAGDFEVGARYGRLLFRRGESAAILRRAKNEDGVIISESLALSRGLAEGDQIPLYLPSGRVDLSVAGVFYDYSTDGGKVVMDRSLWTKMEGEHGADILAIYLQPGADEAAIRRQLLVIAGEDGAIALNSNRALRVRVLEIFDNTFAVARALELIAILVGILGIFNVLWASVLSRRREIGVLRSVGATRAQLVRIILGEAGLLGLLAELLGLLAGIALSFILIHVINKQSFGWTIQFQFSWWIVVKSSIIALGAALLAGYLPARRAARLNIAEAVAYEG
ncbi:multidrug ABC transporter permease [Candidatus Methylomirabilis lanthanidiphila]|uniref:Multidrug ABC transporter permease n=1 Tax=Candidatus Methylomirabilis lanthanidiphila TaxID=2211376 RepID=A0A564ZL76_9BACT|nr:FtsX-like permease family protein [Candidatus Methylomirabilis lanthanidiphila]VUZ85308.1 multidrug ABC transporter permease [Candidatus Methylomirabilis lanthanidiphila]